jgi:hypothetical protein
MMQEPDQEPMSPERLERFMMDEPPTIEALPEDSDVEEWWGDGFQSALEEGPRDVPEHANAHQRKLWFQGYDAGS